MNEVLSELMERGSGIPHSQFGVHKRMKVRFTQEEHEEIVGDRH